MFREQLTEFTESLSLPVDMIMIFSFTVWAGINLTLLNPRSEIASKTQGIFTFENLEKMRFCHTLTYKNCRNLLNFLDRGLKFWI